MLIENTIKHLLTKVVDNILLKELLLSFSKKNPALLIRDFTLKLSFCIFQVIDIWII